MIKEWWKVSGWCQALYVFPFLMLGASGLKCHMSTTLTCLLTPSMEQSPSLEANLLSASQEIPHILWNLRVRACHLSLS